MSATTTPQPEVMMPDPSLLPSDLEMFAELGIPSELVAQARIVRVADREAREKWGIRFAPAQDCSGLIFPYYIPAVEWRVTARLRRDKHEVDAKGKAKNKYLSPYGDNRHLYFPPGAEELLRDPETVIVLVESEKASLALMAWAKRMGMKMAALGTGGCWGWHSQRARSAESPDGSWQRSPGAVDDMKHANNRVVFIMLDSNARIEINAKVYWARAELTVEMNRRASDLRICELPLVDGLNGPDDAVALLGDEGVLEVFRNAHSPAQQPPRQQAAAATRDVEEEADPVWPVLPDAALHGLAGDVVRTIGPYTEADPAAILIQLLVAVGNMVGAGPHCIVESTRHALVLYAVLVGETSKGRKGTSWGHIRRLCSLVDAKWANERVMGGLSSAEGLIAEVRDDADSSHNKRLLVIQPEFAGVLRIMGREGNNLSPVLRGAFDDGEMRTMTKHDPLRATGVQLGLIGHITRLELLRYLSDTESHNGFANRFFWCAIKRSKFLPEGGSVPEEKIKRLAERLRHVVDWAHKKGEFEMRRDDAARKLWAEVYPRLSEAQAGLLGAATSRAEALVLRLSAVYAILDQSTVIRVEHLQAALAVWDYCFASARYIFGDAVGDPVADRIREALEGAGEIGMTRTQIRDLLGRHVSADRIRQALAQLVGLGIATCRTVLTEGRPIELWTATKATKATKG